MKKLTVDLHSDLAQWLADIADDRGMTVEHATERLLDELRMVRCGLTEIDITNSDGERWKAKLPMRGLIYTDFSAEWHRLYPSTVAG